MGDRTAGSTKTSCPQRAKSRQAADHLQKPTVSSLKDLKAALGTCREKPCRGALIELSSLQNNVAQRQIKNAQCQLFTINPPLTPQRGRPPLPADAEGRAPNPQGGPEDPAPADGRGRGLPEGIPAWGCERQRGAARQPACLSLLWRWLVARALGTVLPLAGSKEPESLPLGFRSLQKWDFFQTAPFRQCSSALLRCYNFVPSLS